MNIKDAVNEVTEDIRAQQRGRTTRIERVLTTLLKDDKPRLVTMARLTPVFKGCVKPEQAARNAIERLNRRLKRYGVRITHVTAYRLEEIE